MGAEFFDGLEVGACFWYEIAGTLTFSSGEVQRWQHSVLAEYRGPWPVEVWHEFPKDLPIMR